jgi:4-diphosphocytidyl-2-C-methyl-D-erythritol kinase
MLDHHALGAVMTGTGSAVFAVFDDPANAAAAHKALSRDYEECYLTRPVGRQ